MKLHGVEMYVFGLLKDCKKNEWYSRDQRVKIYKIGIVLNFN